MASPRESQRVARRAIGKKVHELRTARSWSQQDLARRLGLSQASVSNVERGTRSLTAEQFLEVLRLFNVPATAFAPPEADHEASELQNALARHGATHLRESDQIVPSERYQNVTAVVRDVLADGDPRLVTALAPVLVKNVDRLNLHKLELELADAGLERRLWWIAQSVLDAVNETLAAPPGGRWARLLRRAQVVLEAYVDHVSQTRDPKDFPVRDLLDRTLRSKRSVRAVAAASSKSARRWRIVTSIQPTDFRQALNAVLEDD
jgi:transcriptional regulator with XRE-family HTH domain